MKDPVIVVSGLPRSGTSLMMQMLHKGGLEVLVDQLRQADEDNPRGYYEYEPVKRLQQDATWLPDARGKAVKIVSQLLFALPPGLSYRVVLMQRDLDEVLASQGTMLSRSGRAGGDVDKVRTAFAKHLAMLDQWLPTRSDLAYVRVNYRDVVGDPATTAAGVSEFLGEHLAGGLDVDAMVAAVDAKLYRNRRSDG